MSLDKAKQQLFLMPYGHTIVILKNASWGIVPLYMEQLVLYQ